VEPANAHDYERLARERLDGGAYDYYAGGANDERTLRDNVDAFSRLRLRPRVLVDVSGATAATTVLGRELSMPLLVAPIAFQRMAHPDGEQGMARAAAAAGTAMILSTLATSTPAEVTAAAPGAPHWFQLYCFTDRGITRELVEQASQADFEAIVLTVDAPRLGRRERDLRSGWEIPADITVPSFAAAVGESVAGTPADMFSRMDPSLDWDSLEQLVGETELPVLVKGIMTAEDTQLACERGVAGVIVSNHGGRQLDGACATIDALPEVVDAAAGRVPVLVDGGIRRGTDVLKALALGARAVLAGRAPLWGLAAGGERGATDLLTMLRDEIELALALCGCASPADLRPSHGVRGAFE
jgi:isopentenyl diphosphate isomerase/L-lactate dehydrogenase-like FMN-dependent dehydrogenase